MGTPRSPKSGWAFQTTASYRTRTTREYADEYDQVSIALDAYLERGEPDPRFLTVEE